MRLDRADDQIENIRRDDCHLRRLRLLDHVQKAVVQLGIDRLRRHEHQGRRLGFAGDEIFSGDVFHMLSDIGAHARFRDAPLCIVGGCRQRGEAFQRKFGIDDDDGLRSRKLDRAIGPRAVGQRGLKFIDADRERIGDDGFHAALAEGAARLLVGQHLLQRNDMSRQRGDVLLRFVDDGQPRLDAAQRLGGLVGVLFERTSQLLRQRIEALGQRSLCFHRLLELAGDVSLRREQGVQPWIGPHFRHAAGRRSVSASTKAAMTTAPASKIRPSSMTYRLS